MKLKGLFLLVLLVGLGSVSCKKTCVIDKENSDLGAIISESQTGEEVVVYHSGYKPVSISNHYTATHPYADHIEVSFNGGLSRGPVNWNQYNVLTNPVWVSCEAKFDREVLFNPTAQTVTYKLNVTNCGACDQKYYAENYVLIPAVPSSYTVLYDVTYTEVD